MIKKHWPELAVLILQLYMYYIFPLFCGPTDAMGMVLLIFCNTFLFGVLLGICSGRKQKFLWPVIVAVLFLPSIPIWYNSSALVHSLWYFTVSALGLGLGSLLRFLARFFFRRPKGSR